MKAGTSPNAYNIREGLCLAQGRGQGILVRADEKPQLFGPAELGNKQKHKLSEPEKYQLALQTLDKILHIEMRRFSDNDASDAESIIEAHQCMLHDPVLIQRKQGVATRGVICEN